MKHFSWVAAAAGYMQASQSHRNPRRNVGGIVAGDPSSGAQQRIKEQAGGVVRWKGGDSVTPGRWTTRRLWGPRRRSHQRGMGPRQRQSLPETEISPWAENRQEKGRNQQEIVPVGRPSGKADKDSLTGKFSFACRSAHRSNFPDRHF